MSSFRTHIVKNDIFLTGWNSTAEGKLSLTDTGIIWEANSDVVTIRHRFIKSIEAKWNTTKLKLCLENRGSRCVVFVFEDYKQRALCLAEINQVKKSKKRKRKIQRKNQKKKKKRNVLVGVFSSDNFINHRTEDIWRYKICQTFLNVVDFATMRSTNKLINVYWRVFMNKYMMKPIVHVRVPQYCPTLRQALAFTNAYYDKYDYQKRVPLTIELDEGNHKIANCSAEKTPANVLNIHRSHITFIGKGKDKTTIHGGFDVVNQQNVKFEELAITNSRGVGLMLEGRQANVDVLNCVVKDCGKTGMVLCLSANVTATQCEFLGNGHHGVQSVYGAIVRLNDCKIYHNGAHGLFASLRGRANIHGAKTDIHSNKGDGVVTTKGGHVKIHLPFQHNTSHDNANYDRYQEEAGSIANINADGSFV